MNTLKIAVLMAGLTGLLVAIGGAFGGRSGMILCFVLAMGMNFFSYWFSDKIVLKMYGGREVTPAEGSVLYEVTRELAQKASMPMPRVYEIPSDGLNAFATGRNREHAAVAATKGIMRVLTRDELRGVMAHELSHINNRDILIGTIAAGFVGAITMIAHMGQFAMMFGGFGGRRDDEDRGGGLGAIVMMIVAPIGAMMIQMAISRSREYQADASGAKLSGDPRALASALRKLELGAQRMPMDASPATAHMFIVNPLRGGGISKLFSTHPAMEERIKRLEAMQA
jgi:heat shock protein HtpX